VTIDDCGATGTAAVRGVGSSPETQSSGDGDNDGEFFDAFADGNTSTVNSRGNGGEVTAMTSVGQNADQTVNGFSAFDNYLSPYENPVPSGSEVESTFGEGPGGERTSFDVFGSKGEANDLGSSKNGDKPYPPESINAGAVPEFDAFGSDEGALANVFPTADEVIGQNNFATNEGNHNIISNEDDIFAAFDSVTQTNGSGTVMNSSLEEPALSSAEVTQTISESGSNHNSAEEAAENSTDVDSFGVFGLEGAISEKSNALLEVEEVARDVTSASDIAGPSQFDDFGDFATPETNNTAAAQNTSKNYLDNLDASNKGETMHEKIEFSDFEALGSEKVASDGNPSEVSANIDTVKEIGTASPEFDNFGGFATAETSGDAAPRDENGGNKEAVENSSNSDILLVIDGEGNHANHLSTFIETRASGVVADVVESQVGEGDPFSSSSDDAAATMPLPELGNDEATNAVSVVDNSKPDSNVVETSSHEATMSEDHVGIDDFNAIKSNEKTESQESAGDDFGDFRVFDVLPDNSAVENQINDDDFGGFAAFNGSADETVVATQTSDVMADGVTGFGDLRSLSNTEMDHVAHDSCALSGVEDFGDFGAATGEIAPLDSLAVKTTHNTNNSRDSPTFEEVHTKHEPAVEKHNEAVKRNEIEPSGDEQDDDFGGFSSFEEVPPSKVVAADVSGQFETTEPNDADDFDGFASFEEANNDNNEVIDTSPKESVPDHAPAASSDGIDDGDDFGGFASFEEAPAIAPAPLEQSQPNADTTEVENDDFGDFGDFEDFEEAQSEPPTNAKDAALEVSQTSVVEQSAATPAIICDSVRVMFQNVFQTKDHIILNDMASETSELPFNIPLRGVLPFETPTGEEERKEQYKSEKDLEEILTFLKSLPRSPPITILSDEKWYPYSQYVFHDDGTPYADSVERAVPPVVPDVVSVDLPTGFDASELSKTSKPNHDTPSSTVVDTHTNTEPEPSSNDGVDSKKENETGLDPGNYDGLLEDEEVYPKLSATGKRFFDRIPDFSYMLKPALASLEREK